jgi:hypothetical protein
MKSILETTATFTPNKKPANGQHQEENSKIQAETIRVKEVGDDMLGEVKLTVFDRIVVRVEACDEDFRFK